MNNFNDLLFNQLNEVSARLGNDFNIIQANGGNTSIKIDDYIFIKGSGKHLSRANRENIFAKVPLKNFSKNQLKLNIDNEFYIRPSIEQDLHKLISSKIVIHTHPIDIISLTMTLRGKKIIFEALRGLNWIWIDYHKPGKELANALKSKISKKTNIIVLQNHGLVVGSDTPLNAEKLHSQILEKIKTKVRRFKPKKMDILNYLLNDSELDFFLPEYEVVHSLATDPWSFKLIQMNPHCPDHAVFFGLKVPIISKINRDLKEFKESIKELIKEFRYIVIKGIGVLILEKNKTLEVMLKTQAEIFLRIPEEENVSLLTNEQCFELINWEAEKLRKKQM